jgi:hypothetical protein
MVDTILLQRNPGRCRGKNIKKPARKKNASARTIA